MAVIVETSQKKPCFSAFLLWNHLNPVFTGAFFSAENSPRFPFKISILVKFPINIRTLQGVPDFFSFCSCPCTAYIFCNYDNSTPLSFRVYKWKIIIESLVQRWYNSLQ